MTRSPLRLLAFSLLKRLLYLWVRSETTQAASLLSRIDPAKPVLYVLPEASLSDLAVLDRECRKAGLPRPLRPLVLGSKTEPLAYFNATGKANWRGRPARRSVPPTLRRVVTAVTEQQLEDVQLVPVSVFWGQSPDRETSPWKLLWADNWVVTGRLRKLARILVLGRLTRVQFSKPLSLGELASQRPDPQRLERLVMRRLRIHFRNVRQAVIGPDLSHRRTLLRGLLRAPQVRATIAHEIAQRKATPGRIEDEAAHYAREIASDFSYPVVRCLDVGLRWFWNSIYDGVTVSHIERIQEMAPGHTVVYVPCHRSHIDYLLLSYLLFQNGLTPPHIAAGINLDMPVVGNILRRGGAFFMRRSFKGNALYAAVFNEYLHSLFSRGFSTEYFVEGGRSRTGRTLQPRTGMLAMTLRSFLRDSRRPIVFVPVYIGYEKVFEGRTYLGELRGAAKKKESIFDLVKVFGALRQRFGRVWVNFGEPIPLQSFLDARRPGWRDEPLGEDLKPTWFNSVTHELGERVVRRINAAAAVTPVNLVALALLSTHRQALDEGALVRAIDLYLDLLKRVPYSTSVTLPEGDGQAIIEEVRALGFLSEQQDALGRILYLDEQNAVLMTYYRNNVLHLFAIPALIASFFQNTGRMTRELIHRFALALYPYLQAELFIHWEREELPLVLDGWLEAMVERGLLRIEDDVFVRAAPSSRQFVRLTLLARAILQTLQRYYMTTALILNHGQNSLTAPQLEELCTVMAQRLSVLHGLNAPEFFDKSLFRHFIQTLLAEGVLRKADDGTLGHHELLGELAEGAGKRVLPAEIRLSIRQVALDRPEAPDLPEAESPVPAGN
ncbi:glycerol-3-phosphate 1-O-acyltransferase PlsB [Pseudomonas oryzihabitans]|uniref:glycerol-3-phosphate 1-O-acyltransferase PlsB n=1 Tax=Pseudomonas oryzihabitans TaxID=47885 RepID=UPI00119E1CEE|nr:glycerol-3-phosphate 1-O-acyltransferase PlsB [Pseudomonas oryzihabitans]